MEPTHFESGSSNADPTATSVKAVVIKPSNLTSKIVWFSFIVWVILLVAGVLFIFFFRFSPQFEQIVHSGLYPTNFTPQLLANGTFYIRQDLNEPTLAGYGVFYNFEGTITEVKPVEDGAQIFLDTPINNLPEFIVTPKTEIIFGTNHFDMKGFGSLSDLAPETKVKVVVGYSFYRKAWFLKNVYLSS